MTRIKKKRSFIPIEFRPKVKGKIQENSNFQSLLNKKSKTFDSNKKSIVCLYVKDDISQINMIQKYSRNNEIIYLSYDEIAVTWNFSYCKGVLIFYNFSTKEKIYPKGIYNRPYFPDISYPWFHYFNNLMRAIEDWDGEIIGANSTNFHNSSKGYQLISTVRNAINKCKDNSFDIPRSYYVKGAKKFLKFMKFKNSLIVKSCSGIRSEVAIYDQFNKWNLENLNNMPVFFQKACIGPDIRVHRLDEKYWPIILTKKEGSIDYRYAKKRNHFEKMFLEEGLKNFCNELSKIENIRLIGVDFIKVGSKFFCLESNPSPGWAGFHRISGEEPMISRTIIDKLNGEK